MYLRGPTSNGREREEVGGEEEGRGK